MASGSSLPGDLPCGTSCADYLIMVLREYILEMKLVQQEAQYFESLLRMLSTQQLSKQEKKVAKEIARPGLEGNMIFSSRHSSNSNRSGMFGQMMSSDACISATNNNAHPSQEEFLVERAAQRIQNNMEDIVITSMRSPPPRVQSTVRVHVGEQPPALQEGPNRAPKASVAPEQLDPSVTTLYVRFIPPKASQEDLLALWPPTWGYNFLHLPYSAKQRRSVGYAFINFVSNEAARLFYSRWEGHILPLEGHSRPLSVQAARVQGVQQILEHLETQGISQAKNHRHLPVLFAGVERISFKAVLKVAGVSRTRQ